jgi:hypothetical protein
MFFIQKKLIFMPIRPAAVGLLYADRTTDMKTLTVIYRKFAKAPKISASVAIALFHTTKQ